jgi:DNA polymerase-3 subunit gamma/tau
MAGMSHVLARKYRPQVFADLIGQEALVRTITNAIMTDRLAHAYMLTGIRGVGKTSSARIIAKGLNCIGADGKGGMTPNPCGVCQHCRDIAADSHIDVIEIDAASNTGVDNVREIIEGAKYNPVSARFKIYIIDEVHMLSKQAFNALLKTLEEPPERIKFIFATTEIRKVPITILSRCQRFDLRRLDEDVLAKHLAMIADKENVKFEEDALKLLARAGDGSVRDSLSLMDQAMTQLDGNLTVAGVRKMLGLSDKTVLFDLYEQMMAGQIAEALKTISVQYECGADPFETVQDLLALTHWLTRVKVVPSTAEDVTVSETERVRGKALAEKLSMASLTAAWQMLLKGVQEVRLSDSPINVLEMLIIRLAYLSEMPSPIQILDDIKKNGKITPTFVQATRVPEQRNVPEKINSPTPKEPEKPKECGIQNLEQVVALARQAGERVLAFQIENCMRPVEVKSGLIKCVLTPDSNRDIIAKTSQFLTKKTGINWIVQTQVSGGGQTLQEQKESKQNALLEELKKTPVVEAVLKSFTGAKIEKVKPIKAKEETPDDESENTIELEE